MSRRTVAVVAYLCFALAVLLFFLASAGVDSPVNAVMAAFALAAAVAFASLRRRALR
jgi:MYXO-CTERM domain-containing protein